MPLLPDLGIAAAAAGVTFFLLLGLLVIFLETIEPKLFLGSVFILIGLTLALFLVNEAGVALITLGVMGALLVDQAIKHFAGL